MANLISKNLNREIAKSRKSKLNFCKLTRYFIGYKTSGISRNFLRPLGELLGARTITKEPGYEADLIGKSTGQFLENFYFIKKLNMKAPKYNSIIT
jgi:hypothetical protein